MTRVFIYEPVGLDAWEGKHPEHVGRRVIKTQPSGCPRNGTMGHCFIAEVTSGHLIGLVLENSLKAAS